MTPAKARRLFKAGATARAVMLDAGIGQSSLTERTGLPQSRIAELLAGRRTGGPRGRAMARVMYEEIAMRLGIEPKDIPEARPYADGPIS